MKKIIKKIISIIFKLIVKIRKKPIKKNGINIIGDIHSESGLGNIVRELINSMQDYEINIVNVPLAIKSRKNEGLNINSSGILVKGINIYVGTPISLITALLKLRDVKVITNYNIGVWFWELDKIPELWKIIGGVIDEVWCQSNYIKDAFLSDGKKINYDIKIMPFSLDISEKIKKENKKFTYITTFDFLSHASRKNPLATLEAYMKCWKEEDNCELIIKTVNATYDKKTYKIILRMINKRKDIKLIDEYMSSKGARELIGGCDVYISLHRSEGLGMGMAEAIKMGVPVIATGYSGNLQYMDESTSWLVKYELIKANNYPDSDGCLWAEPDIADATRNIKNVKQNEYERNLKKIKAYEKISVYNKENQIKWIIENIK